MPRTVTNSFRRSIESRNAEDVDLCFITITHDLLVDPIRVVWDTVDFTYGGNTFTGFPFDIELLTDDDQPPKAQLVIQNVDQIIGKTIRGLKTAPRLKIELLSSLDFDLTSDPRAPISTPSVAYSADKLFLRNVEVNVMQVTADIVGWDNLQRVWPGVRATQDLLPALFR